jgi:hypothetical protein
MTGSEHRHTLPDGRELIAVYAPDRWTVHVAGDEAHPVTGREIHDVLVALIEPGPGLWPDWFKEAANALAGFDTPDGRRSICPCCGELTLAEAPTGTYEICAVCGWEDDNVQFRDPDSTGGANELSLNQARARYRAT